MVNTTPTTECSWNWHWFQYRSCTRWHAKGTYTAKQHDQMARHRTTKNCTSENVIFELAQILVGKVLSICLDNVINYFRHTKKNTLPPRVYTANEKYPRGFRSLILVECGMQEVVQTSGTMFWMFCAVFSWSSLSWRSSQMRFKLISCRLSGSTSMYNFRNSATYNVHMFTKLVIKFGWRISLKAHPKLSIPLEHYITTLDAHRKYFCFHSLILA